MGESYQFTFDDMQLLKYIEEQPGRIAYIDECGHFGFDFEKKQTSKYFILCAIVVENSRLKKLHDDFIEVKKTNGLANTELKSSGLDDKHRKRIMDQVMALEFRIVLFIADKQQFMKDQGVILASSVHGYKIPISIDDIYTYLNSTTSTVGPMMERMGICRKLIKQATDNELDVFNDEAYIKYKRYFDD